MKKYCICTVCSMVLGVLSLFAFLYSLCRGLNDEALFSFMLMIFMIGGAFFSYYSVKLIRRIREKYDSFYDPKSAEDYLMTLGDTPLELFFSSFSEDELLEKKHSYEHRLVHVGHRRYRSFIEKSCDERTCHRLLRFITKNLQI